MRVSFIYEELFENPTDVSMQEYALSGITNSTECSVILGSGSKI
jgi:hypothetical protein